MGVSIESSNYALPWSMAANWLKKRSLARSQASAADKELASIHHVVHRRRKTGSMRTLLRVCNRLLEGGYRLAVAGVFRLRGYHVLFDRYFLFEAAPTVQDGKPVKLHPIEAWYFRVWRYAVPLPSVTIFLDGPAEILLARKGEGDAQYFEEKRSAWMDVGRSMRNFYVVDATKPVDVVYEAVWEIVSDALTREAVSSQQRDS
jgi:hypothetical protein